MTLKEGRSSRQKALNIIDIEYADELAVIADNLKNANFLLQKLK